MLRSLLCLVLICTAGALSAGAWQREPGSGFAAATVRLGWPQNLNHWTSYAPTSQYNTLYLEYGLTPRLTLGADLGHAVSGRSKSIVFLQFPLRTASHGPKIAAQLGVGVVAQERVIRPGLSMGWGRPNGWVSVDSAVEIGLESGSTDWKVDMTWGRNMARGHKIMLQVQTGETAIDPPFIRIAPAIVRPLGKRLKIETGAAIGLYGDTSMGLTMGLWADF